MLFRLHGGQPENNSKAVIMLAAILSKGSFNTQRDEAYVISAEVNSFYECHGHQETPSIAVFMIQLAVIRWNKKRFSHPTLGYDGQASTDNLSLQPSDVNAAVHS